MKQSSVEIVIYKGSEGVSLDVRLEGESVWLDAHQCGAFYFQFNNAPLKQGPTLKQGEMK